MLFTGIDYLPTAADLVQASGDVAAIAAIANDDGGDPGTRIRAYRSLGVFDSPTAKASLAVTLTTLRDSAQPVDQLYLIAAAEALGQHGRAEAVAALAPLLDHESRDVRAAAATALGRTQASEACDPLRSQAAVEQNPQVDAALNAALVELSAECQVGR